MALDLSLPETSEQESPLPFVAKMVLVRPEVRDNFPDNIGDAVFETVADEERGPDLEYAKAKGIQLTKLPRALLLRHPHPKSQIPVVAQNQQVTFDGDGQVTNQLGSLPFDYNKVGFLMPGFRLDAEGRVSSSKIAYQYSLYSPQEVLAQEARAKVNHRLANLANEFKKENVLELNQFLEMTTGLNLFDMVKTLYYIYNSVEVDDPEEVKYDSPEAFISSRIGISEQLATSVITYSQSVDPALPQVSWESFVVAPESVVPAADEVKALPEPEVVTGSPLQQIAAGLHPEMISYRSPSSITEDEIQSVLELVASELTRVQAGDNSVLFTSNAELARLLRIKSKTYVPELLAQHFEPEQLELRKAKIRLITAADNRSKREGMEGIEERKAMVLDFLQHQIAYIERIGNIENTEIAIPSNDKLGRMFGLGAKSVAIILNENFTPEQLEARKKILDQQVNVDRKVPKTIIDNAIEIVTDQLDAIERGEVDVNEIYSSKDIVAILKEKFPDIKISASSVVNIINKMLSEEALEFRRDIISDNRERRFVNRSKGQIDPKVKEKMAVLVRDQLQRISMGEIGAGDISTNIELAETFGINRVTVRNVLRGILSAEELGQRAVLIEEKRVSRGVDIDGEYYGSADEAAFHILMHNYLGYELTRSRNYQVTREINENGKRKWIIVDFIVDNQGKRYYIDYHPAHLELMEDLVDGKNPYQRARELYPNDLEARKNYLQARGKELLEAYKGARQEFIPEGAEYRVMSDAGQFYDFLSTQAVLEDLPSRKEFIDLYNAMIREFRKSVVLDIEEGLTG